MDGFFYIEGILDDVVFDKFLVWNNHIIIFQLLVFVDNVIIAPIEHSYFSLYELLVVFESYWLQWLHELDHLDIVEAGFAHPDFESILVSVHFEKNKQIFLWVKVRSEDHVVELLPVLHQSYLLVWDTLEHLYPQFKIKYLFVGKGHKSKLLIVWSQYVENLVLRVLKLVFVYRKWASNVSNRNFRIALLLRGEVRKSELDIGIGHQTDNRETREEGNQQIFETQLWSAQVVRLAGGWRSNFLLFLRQARRKVKNWFFAGITQVVVKHVYELLDSLPH